MPGTTVPPAGFCLWQQTVEICSQHLPVLISLCVSGNTNCLILQCLRLTDPQTGTEMKFCESETKKKVSRIFPCITGKLKPSVKKVRKFEGS